MEDSQYQNAKVKKGLLLYLEYAGIMIFVLIGIIWLGTIIFGARP